jgi:DNA-binding transcriptional MerR regulator
LTFQWLEGLSLARAEAGGEWTMPTFTIGRVAEATGVAARTIRYYEQIGVLPVPNRTASGYREYDQAAVQRVRFVRRARSLGLPLRELKTLRGMLSGPPRPALRPRLIALVRSQLSAVKHQIADLEVLQQELEQVLRRPLASAPQPGREGCRCLEAKG